MYKPMAAALVGFILATPFFAGGHTDEYLDSINAPNGGQMRMAGPYHLELITREKEILLHVTDHADKKISTGGGIGKVTFQEGKAKPKNSFKLEPGGDNTLKGVGNFSVTPDTVITVFLKLPEHEAQSARFAPLKPKAKLATNKQDEKNSMDDSEKHQHHH